MERRHEYCPLIEPFSVRKIQFSRLRMSLWRKSKTALCPASLSEAEANKIKWFYLLNKCVES